MFWPGELHGLHSYSCKETQRPSLTLPRETAAELTSPEAVLLLHRIGFTRPGLHPEWLSDPATAGERERLPQEGSLQLPERTARDTRRRPCRSQPTHSRAHLRWTCTAHGNSTTYGMLCALLCLGLQVYQVMSLIKYFIIPYSSLFHNK